MGFWATLAAAKTMFAKKEAAALQKSEAAVAQLKASGAPPAAVAQTEHIVAAEYKVATAASKAAGLPPPAPPAV